MIPSPISRASRSISTSFWVIGCPSIVRSLYSAILRFVKLMIASISVIWVRLWRFSLDGTILLLASSSTLMSRALQILRTLPMLALATPRGVANASIGNVLKICKALDISVDELANNRIVPSSENLQRRTHMTDIDAIISFTKRNIAEYNDLTIDGQPMTQNEVEMLLDALDIGLGIIKRNRERNK